MKKILMIFILIALLMPGLVLAEATDQTQPITVACLGDSITFGAGVKGKENTYPAMLQVLLGNDFVVKNCGENERTLQREGMLNGPDAAFNFPMTYWDSKVMNNAIAAQPDIVIIMLGTNDAKQYNWNAERYTDEYIELVQLFQGMECVSQVCVMIPPPVFELQEGMADDEIDRNVISQELKTCIQNVAAATGCPVIDLFQPFVSRADLFPDCVHPNKDGNKIIAETVYTAICDQD